VEKVWEANIILLKNGTPEEIEKEVERICKSGIMEEKKGR